MTATNSDSCLVVVQWWGEGIITYISLCKIKCTKLRQFAYFTLRREGIGSTLGRASPVGLEMGRVEDSGKDTSILVVDDQEGLRGWRQR